MMGYYNISYQNPYNASTPLVLAGGLYILNSTTTAFDDVFTPILDHISATYAVIITHATHFAPSMYEWWSVQYPPGPVATIDSALGSRLLDEKALSTPLTQLAGALSDAYPGLLLLGNLVTGPGVWNAKPAGGLGSMTPAWRKAVVHMSMFEPLLVCFA